MPHRHYARSTKLASKLFVETISAESLIEARYRRQDCTPVQCFARRGDERVDAHISVALIAPTLLGFRSARFLQPGGHFNWLLRAEKASLFSELPVSKQASRTLIGISVAKVCQGHAMRLNIHGVASFRSTLPGTLPKIRLANIFTCIFHSVSSAIPLRDASHRFLWMTHSHTLLLTVGREKQAAVLVSLNTTPSERKGAYFLFPSLKPSLLSTESTRHRSGVREAPGLESRARHERGRGDRVVRLLASHKGEPGSIPGGVTYRFSHVGIVPDDAADRRVSPGISRFPPLLHSGAAPFSPHFTFIGSQDLDVKSRPNLSTHSLTGGVTLTVGKGKGGGVLGLQPHIPPPHGYGPYDKGYITTGIKCAIAPKSKARNWRAVFGAAASERLARSPPTKANRVQSPAGSPDFCKWESCRTMPLVGGFSRGSPVSPAPSFRSCSIFTLITLIGSQDLAQDVYSSLGVISWSGGRENCLPLGIGWNVGNAGGLAGKHRAVFAPSPSLPEATKHSRHCLPARYSSIAFLLIDRFLRRSVVLSSRFLLCTDHLCLHLIKLTYPPGGGGGGGEGYWSMFAVAIFQHPARLIDRFLFRLYNPSCLYPRRRWSRALRLIFSTFPNRKYATLHILSCPRGKFSLLFSGRVTPDFRMWESCRTMSFIGGFSRGSPVSTALSFRRCSMLILITLIGSQDLDYHDGNTVLLAHKNDEALGVHVSVARIAP
ncbi:hypothetical protein PR048_033674 [Dryococelus australis]|uniref:Uncharacterized protein n=1 Tax=Dryococelus australis TaxID=614101 RepID=A0ABQ9G0Z4_9NEOP|nr:hypothetical protein PR048_033674 [Dryococelus australis]